MRFSKRLSLIPSDHKIIARFSLLRKISVAGFWERDTVIRIVVIFWVVCGMLWLLSGISLLLGLSPAIRIVF
jgi:hypothetical protein